MAKRGGDREDRKLVDWVNPDESAALSSRLIGQIRSNGSRLYRAMLATMACARAYPRFPPQEKAWNKEPRPGCIGTTARFELDSRDLSTKQRKGVDAKGSEGGGTGEYKSGTVETEVGKLNLLCDTLRARVPTDVGVLLLRHFQDVRRNFSHPPNPSFAQ